MTEATQPTETDTTDEFVETLFGDLLGAFRLAGVHVGSRLGFYDVLAAEGPKTSVALAAAAGTNERYTREWLEQGAVAGVLSVENPDAEAGERRFSLPDAHVEVLCDEESLNYLAPFATLFVAALRPIDAVLDAYRTGEGVPYTAYGSDFHEGQAAANRPAFLHLLGSEWLPTMADVDETLRAGGRVADVGCGHGWSSIGIARAYPETHVLGIDLDAGSIERAREHVARSDLDDRVTFEHVDAADVTGEFDLVTAFECVHDMTDPVAVRSTMRSLAGDDGAVLVVDERVSEEFTPDAGEVEEMMYGWSVLHCLPVSTLHAGVGTGTVMREGTLRGYADAAGFADCEVLPIRNDFFRFYRLTP